MKKTALALIVLLFSLLCITGFAAGNYQMGDTIEDFSVTTPAGETVTLSGLLEQHKAVLLNFWYVDCPWCVYEFPFLQNAYDATNGEIAVLALSPYDTNERIAQFQQQNNLTFLMARDTIGLAQRFGCTGYPTSIMVDRNGVYCFAQSGAFTATGAVRRLFTAFSVDDYAESLVDFRIPASVPPAAPDSIALSDALNAEGGELQFSTISSNSMWPWLIREDAGRTCAYSSNSYEDSTSALVFTSVSVQAGDVLAFDYKTSSGIGDDMLALYVDDTPVKVFSGETDWNSYAHAFSQAGDYTVYFYYMKSSSGASGDDMAALDNVCILSGDAAQTALQHNPVYSQMLAGTNVEIELLHDSAREVLVHDASGTLDSYYPGPTFFLVPDHQLSVRIRIGTSIDPDAALLRNLYDNSVVPLSSLPHDEQGYLYTTSMDSLETTGYAWNLLVVYPVFNDYSIMTPVFTFASEENLDHFCLYNVTDQGEVSWTYANANARYTLVFTDQFGAPIPGMIVNVCSDTFCMPMTTDENGAVSFENAPYAYEIHVLKAPESYVYDPAEAFVAPIAGGEISFVLTRN